MCWDIIDMNQEDGQVASYDVLTLDDNSFNELDIIKLLYNRYGDGYVYLSLGVQEKLYIDAINYGYISDEGYISKKGR